MADYPLINGLAQDWASFEFDIGGTIVLGVKELTWTETLEPGIIRGSGSAQKLARTKGEHNAEGSMVLWREDAQALIARLAASGGDELGWMEVSFDITANCSSPGTTASTTKLRGCRITSHEAGGSQGTDPAENSFDLDIIQIEEDGYFAVGGALI